MPGDTAGKTAGIFRGPRGDEASEVRPKEAVGKTTPHLARGPAKAGGRREPNTAGTSLARRTRSEPRRQALIFENRIVDCRVRSIRIGVIEGVKSVLARKQNEPPILLGARRPARVARGDDRSSSEAEGCVHLEGTSGAVAESAVASSRGDTEAGSSTIRHVGASNSAAPSVKRRIPETG